MISECWICGRLCDPDDPSDNSMRIEENDRCFCSLHLEEGFVQILSELGFKVDTHQIYS